MRLSAEVVGITGTTDCTFTLKDFGAHISTRLGYDPSCPYHFGMFDIKSAAYMSRLDINAIGFDAGGAVIANTIQGMAPTLGP